MKTSFRISVVSVLAVSFALAAAPAQAGLFGRGEKGRLYGSVTAQEVADAIQVGYEVEIDKRKVEIKEPVRQLGDYEVTVHLYPNVSTRMLLRVKNVAEG